MTIETRLRIELAKRIRELRTVKQEYGDIDSIRCLRLGRAGSLISFAYLAGIITDRQYNALNNYVNFHGGI